MDEKSAFKSSAREGTEPRSSVDGRRRSSEVGKQRAGESGAAMNVARWSSALFLTVLAWSTRAHATVVEPRELDQMVKEAEYIGSVWIEQATSIADGPAMTYPACGASYH